MLIEKAYIFIPLLVIGFISIPFFLKKHPIINSPGKHWRRKSVVTLALYSVLAIIGANQKLIKTEVILISTVFFIYLVFGEKSEN